MGVVNATPDSFSGDGCGDSVTAAVERGLAQERAGAAILDVGGESTRPGAEPVPESVELARVVPVVRALCARTHLPVSIDTHKPAVAASALEAGACVINDVWGLRRDPRMAAVARMHGAAWILTHNRAAVPLVDSLGGMYPHVAYGDVVADIQAELRAAAAWAIGQGVPHAAIWLDPGLGFGKTPAQSLEILRRLSAFRLGHPLVVGPSRKSFVGRVLDAPVGERDAGTAAAVALCAAAGADIVRVHNVGMMARAARVADAVVRGWP